VLIYTRNKKNYALVNRASTPIKGALLLVTGNKTISPVPPPPCAYVFGEYPTFVMKLLPGAVMFDPAPVVIMVVAPFGGGI
jgi:hypothetical protein